MNDQIFHVEDGGEAEKPSVRPEASPCRLGKTWPLLLAIVISGAYAFFYDAAPIGAKEIVNQKILSFAERFGIYAGLLPALLAMLLGYALILIKKLVRCSRFCLLNPILFALSALPILAFANQMVYHEPRHTDIAKAVIDFAGPPLYAASLAAIIIAGFWLALGLVLSLLRKIRS